MASVQDQAPAIKELSDERQQDPKPSQTTQQPRPKSRDASDSSPPRTGTSETLQEPSPPRFSQFRGTLPGTSESNPPRRGPSTVSLVNNRSPSNGTGAAPRVTSGLGSAPPVQDRSLNRSTSLAPDRRNPTLYYDPIQGENPVQAYLPDNDEFDRGIPTRPGSFPRPMPIFSPTQDVNGGVNGSGGSERGVSGSDWFLVPREPVRLVLVEYVVAPKALIHVL